jgi:RhoGAP domain
VCVCVCIGAYYICVYVHVCVHVCVMRLLRFVYLRICYSVSRSDFATRVSRSDCGSMLSTLLLRCSLLRLPPGNRFVLRFLMEFLVKVAAKESVNRMGAGNLAVVFAPGLLRPERETMDMVFGKVTSANSLLETFIVDFDKLFVNAERKETVEQQPVDRNAAFQTQEFEKALMRGTIRLASHMVLTQTDGRR